MDQNFSDLKPQYVYIARKWGTSVHSKLSLNQIYKITLLGNLYI